MLLLAVGEEAGRQLQAQAPLSGLVLGTGAGPVMCLGCWHAVMRPGEACMAAQASTQGVPGKGGATVAQHAVQGLNMQGQTRPDAQPPRQQQ